MNPASTRINPIPNRMNPSLILTKFHSFSLRCPIRMNPTHFERFSIPSNTFRATISIRILVRKRDLYVTPIRMNQKLIRTYLTIRFNPKYIRMSFNPFQSVTPIRMNLSLIRKDFLILFNP